MLWPYIPFPGQLPGNENLTPAPGHAATKISEISLIVNETEQKKCNLQIIVLRIIRTVNEELYNSYSFLLDRTARRVKQYAQQKFKEFNLNITVDQWLVLKHLYENETLKQNELAELLFKDNPTLTRIIDLLCEKELTRRKQHPADRRSFLVTLTKKGRKKVELIKPRIQKIRLKAWEGLSRKDFNHFQRVLNTIYQNLE